MTFLSAFTAAASSSLTREIPRMPGREPARWRISSLFISRFTPKMARSSSCLMADDSEGSLSESITAFGAGPDDGSGSGVRSGAGSGAC